MNTKYIITIFTIFFFIVMCGAASAWLPDYDYRMTISVFNGEDHGLTNYQFNFTNDTNVLVASGHMLADGSDCRITDFSDNLIPFWNESAFNAVNTTIWANATLAVGDNVFYMYYGNITAVGVGDGDTTFNFFDDFDYNDTALWNGTRDTIFSGIHWGETSIVMSGDTACCWVGAGSNHRSLEYSCANDSKSAVYSQYSGNPILTDIRFPEVIMYNDTYYLFSHNNVSTEGLVGDVYLWSSTDNVTWNMMNDGRPILEHSDNTSAWNNLIANVAVCVVNDRWHMLIEGMYNGAGFWRGGYSYSNLTELNWTIRATVINELMSCPDIVHVPDRNALMVFAPTGDAALTMKSYHASLADNLSLASSWHDDGVLGLGNDVADGMFAVVGNNKENNIIFQHLSQDGPSRQEYSNLSLNAFYDLITTQGLTEVWSNDTSYASYSDGILTYAGSGTGAWRNMYSLYSNQLNYSMSGRFNSTDAHAKIGFENYEEGEPRPGRSVVYASNVYSYADDGTTYEMTPGVYSYGTWNTFDIHQLSGTRAGFYINDILIATHTISVGSLDQTTMIGSYQNTFPIDVDWLFSRKYTAIEPIASLGTEESAPAGGDSYIPPDPTNLQHTTSVGWVNYTWNAGNGNVTDSFCVLHNQSWINGSANEYLNSYVGKGNWSNITVYAWNSSIGNLSACNVNDQNIAQNTTLILTPATNPFQGIINIIDAVISIITSLFRLILAAFPVMIAIALLSMLSIFIIKMIMGIKK